MTLLDTSNIDNIIVGRVDPHIYAFTTGTVPEYLKVGDTYRPVSVRLQEWREFFPDLTQQYEHIAKTNNGKYYRDFAVHNYLEDIKKRHRLAPDDIKNLVYYSREFFKNATNEDIEEAIRDIEYYAHQAGQTRYQFYSEDRLPQTEHYERTETFDPRPNQQKTINAFNEARNNGRRNLLMYAVMRFGKSFTSMCCATEMKAKVVLIVSAKADVKEEWKHTVESHVRFKDYIFLDSEALVAEPKSITKALEQKQCVAVFLTLQDLMGDDIKAKHKDLFNNTVDLLIVDETHFGARAEEYGKILQNTKLTATQKRKELSNLDETLDNLEEGLNQLKTLKTDITLHLSGTPYRILMGSEFAKEDIIAFFQFTDIIDDKEEWDKEYLHNDDVKEWDNPYYGFPQMIRFAFHPNASSQRLLQEMRENGQTAALNELFRPASISQDADGKYKQFAHPKEVLDLLEIIDGSQQEEDLLSFLDYSKLKEGKMCHHMVFVLPFCASCDAMETLLKEQKSKFKNLSQYEIINIAGKDSVFSDNDDVKKRITEAEQAEKKTISLTVNKMLTGCTVPEWDTMIFLKDVSSPQEYDQAIFRLQNQFIKRFTDENGNVVKYNMKPQTLLVDFDVNRMFIMQEQKSKIYNVNTEERGNDELEKRINRELQISPIIVINKNKLVEATPSDIMDAVRQYSASRTVMDEALEIPIDFDILQDPNILHIIEGLEPINAKKGITIQPIEGEGDDYDFPDEPFLPITDRTTDNGSPSNNESEEKDDKDKRLATYFSQILFFAMLTNKQVHSLKDIIGAIDADTDNERIAKNVGINSRALTYLSKRLNPFHLSDLDYKIQNINSLIHDDSIAPIERVEIALNKFGRLSDSEIVTPPQVADKMVALLPKDEITETTKFLDIASKEGEFACALYKRFGEKIKNNIHALPTSKLTYEFTRKVFSLLDIPIDNIISTFNSYDLIGPNKEQHIQTLKNMNVDIIVGNPPYQASDGGAGASAIPIYNDTVDIAKTLNPQSISLIMPSRWMTGGRGLDDFRKDMLNDRRIKILYDYYDATECFSNVEIKGGVCHFLWKKSYAGMCEIHTFGQGEETISNRFLQEEGIDIFVRDSELLSIKQKVESLNEPGFDTIVSSMKPYGLRGDFFKNPSKYGLPAIRKTYKDGDITIIGLDEKLHRVRRYIPSTYPLPQRELLDQIKIFAPRNYGSGKMGDMPTNLEFAKPNEICTETFVQIGPFNNMDEAQNCEAYMRTKLFTILVGIRKQDQGAGKSVYKYAPVQDFTKKWTDEMLYEKYKITKKEQEYIDKILAWSR